MATIQCKQCGGDVDLPEGMTSGVCPYCNSLTTFPKITDSRMEQLYARAEQFRRNSDFDKAVSAYEQLIQMDPEDPEYYWGLVISRYGIEYVEDPVSHERVPTCHRVQYDSILADADYQSVLSLSSGNDHDIYEKEANRIAEIQKGILTISAQEKPYDVFICYKETTDGGTRTRDSTLAQDIYYQLTNIGYKVFFARITLEDKLGQLYEPYIFAALNSAKVMLVIGSKKEFFEAVWVRNEWSRFLALMKKDRTKLLIPCYSGMDPYDLPTELSMFQAQDMSKIGFLQDLIHGIRKVVRKDAKTAPTGNPANSGTQGKNNPLLRRAMLFLETGNYEETLNFCEQTLNQEPENGWAYYYRLMAEERVKDINGLAARNLTQNKTFNLVLRFADAELQSEVKKIEEVRRQAEEKARKAEEERLRAEEEARLEQKRRKEEVTRTLRTQTINRMRQNAENIEIRPNSLDKVGQLLLAMKKHPGKDELTESLQQLQQRIYDRAVSCELSDPSFAENCLALLPDMPQAVELQHRIIFRNLKNKGKTSDDFFYLERHFRTHYEETDDPFNLTLADECRRIAVELNHHEIYQEADGLMKKYRYLQAARKFELLPNYADALNKAAWCRRRFRNVAIVICVVIGIIGIIVFSSYSAANRPENLYNRAVCYLEGQGVDKDISRARELFERAAEKGHVQAMYQLGVCYRGSNDSEAVPWYRKAAEHGHIDAQYQLGICCLNGIGTNKDPAEAVKWLQKAAEEGHVEAQYQLGICYDNGIGTGKDYAEALKWYRKAVEKNHARAQYQLGICYAQGRGVVQDFADAAKWFRKAAEQEHVDGQFNLGICYAKGQGVPKNETEAVILFQKAAERGHIEAQYQLGGCYEQGRGIGEDPAEAMKWYRKAADQGNAAAQNSLGECYYYGRGVTKNKTEAVKWFQKAAEKGYAEAKISLNKHNLMPEVYFQKGLQEHRSGTWTSEVEKWYLKAAEQGHAAAQYKLGCGYLTYRGGDEGEKWLRKAADQGYSKAQYELGKCYYYGRGVIGDKTKAVKWFRKAAEQELAEAQFNLGICYAKGEGVEQNEETAVEWLRKAARQGDKDARQTLSNSGLNW